MNYAAMATMANELSGTSSDDYSPTRLLPFFNAVKDDLWSYCITGIRSNYNWDTWWVTATFANQTEYRIPEAASDSEGNVKIDWISLCYDWATFTDGTKKYIPAREVNPKWLKHHWNYYVNNQPATDPIYYTADQSIFIAPAFSWDIPNWIEISWIKNIVDYTISATEAQIWLPTYLHMTLVQWVLPFIHKSESKKDEASFEQREYEKLRSLAMDKFANRSVWPSVIQMPNVSTRNEDDDIFPN